MKICRDIFESCAAWRWNVLLRPLIVGADMSVAANIGVRCEASCSDTFSLHSLALMSSDKALLCRPVIYCNVLIDVYLCSPRWVSAWQTAWKQIFSQALTSRRKWNLSSALCFSLEFVVVLFFLHTHDKIRKRAGKYPLTSFMLSLGPILRLGQLLFGPWLLYLWLFLSHLVNFSMNYCYYVL